LETRVKRALIVDDNTALARVTQFALDGAGYETETACNGREAFELALESHFDIVITDQQMPVMTGVELCQLLRNEAEYANCPIILLTAKGLELELHRLREELGIDATFAKPFSPSAIVKSVGELLALPA
jgi:CheY-like chemotaxis protein